MNENLLQLGTVAILFLLFIKEFFAYLKNKKSNNKNDEIVQAIKLLEENDLRCIKLKLEKLDDKLDRVVNLLIKIREKLGR